VKEEITAEVQAAAVKLSPVGAVAGAGAAGWGPEQWMYALTAGYVVLQAIYLLWKWQREVRKRG
jgi:uncharacterized membrane protein YfcA